MVRHPVAVKWPVAGLDQVVVGAKHAGWSATTKLSCQSSSKMCLRIAPLLHRLSLCLFSDLLLGPQFADAAPHRIQLFRQGGGSASVHVCVANLQMWADSGSPFCPSRSLGFEVPTSWMNAKAAWSDLATAATARKGASVAQEHQTQFPLVLSPLSSFGNVVCSLGKQKERAQLQRL